MNYLILNQLGTPRSPNPDDVGIYLTEFLMDPQVIGLPRPFLDILVRIGIVPRRKFASAEKYKKVWTKEGSPLAVNTENLRLKLETSLGSGWKVITGMRYGGPSIAEALSQVAGKSAERVVYMPLYPQYADATVGSALNKLKVEAKKCGLSNEFEIVTPFYDRDWYRRALTRSILKNLKADEHLLLSYHGIPISQEKRAKFSYYQQCMQTSEAIAQTLKLTEKNMSTSFQSRVGLAKWLEPSTEDTAKRLAADGIKKIKVACPSFVADCLETIEEIGMELKHTFISAGGEQFDLIPCLNDDSAFVDGIVEEIRKI